MTSPAVPNAAGRADASASIPIGLSVDEIQLTVDRPRARTAGSRPRAEVSTTRMSTTAVSRSDGVHPGSGRSRNPLAARNASVVSACDRTRGDTDDRRQSPGCASSHTANARRPTAATTISPITERDPGHRLPRPSIDEAGRRPSRSRRRSRSTHTISSQPVGRRGNGSRIHPLTTRTSMARIHTTKAGRIRDGVMTPGCSGSGVP